MTEFMTSSSEHSVQKQPPAQSAAGSSRTKPKLRRHLWRDEELHILFTAFGRDMTEKSMPCGKHNADLARKLPGRTVAQIHVQVSNVITGKVAIMARLTMVPNVPWHKATHRKGAPAPPRKIFLGYLTVIYIGNQITDINAIRYHTSKVHGLLGILLYAYDVRHYQMHIYKCMAFHTFRL